MVPVSCVCRNIVYGNSNDEKCSDNDVTNDCLDRGSTIEYRYEVGSLFYIYYIFKAEL